MYSRHMALDFQGLDSLETSPLRSVVLGLLTRCLEPRWLALAIL